MKDFTELRQEESGKYRKAIEIRTYSRIPSFYIMMIDRNTSQGRAYISHYIHPTIQEHEKINAAIRRADTPYIEVYKSQNPILFEVYNQLVTQIIGSSELYLEPKKLKSN